MCPRLTTKLAVGALVTVAALVLTALPAAANTATVEIVLGQLDIGGFLELELADPGYECSESPLGTELTFMEGSVTGVYHRRSVVEQPWLGYVLLDLYIGITGAWFPGSPETISGTASIQLEITFADDETDCSPEAGPCDIAIDDVEIGGSFYGSLPTTGIGDVMTSSGGNVDETMVNPSDEVCGWLVLLDGTPAQLDLWFQVIDVA